MSTQNKFFNIGFVSSPHPHSAFHIKTLELVASIKEIHLCCIEGQDADEFTALSGKIKTTSNSLTDLINNDRIDALIVSVRNDLCAPILEIAATAGKHVLFEKPGAIHSKDLQKPFEIATKKHLNLSVMFQNRYSPEIKVLKKHIADGYFGRIMSAEARTVTSQVRYRNPAHWLFNKKQSGSGILSWLACHNIDLLCHLLNDQVVEVAAMVDNLNEENLEVEDTAILALKFSKGTLASLHAGYQLAGSPPGYSGGLYDSHFSIRGTSGYGTIPSNDNIYKFYSETGDLELAGIQTMAFSPSSSAAYGGKAGEYFIENFLKCIDKNQVFQPSIDSAIRVLKIIEAALESSQSGKSVRINQT